MLPTRFLDVIDKVRFFFRDSRGKFHGGDTPFTVSGESWESRRFSRPWAARGTAADLRSCAATDLFSAISSCL